jgi:hypothetical protein
MAIVSTDSNVPDETALMKRLITMQQYATFGLGTGVSHALFFSSMMLVALTRGAVGTDRIIVAMHMLEQVLRTSVIPSERCLRPTTLRPGTMQRFASACRRRSTTGSRHVHKSSADISSSKTGTRSSKRAGDHLGRWVQRHTLSLQSACRSCETSLAGAHRLATGHPTATAEVRRNCSCQLQTPMEVVRGCSHFASFCFQYTKIPVLVYILSCPLRHTREPLALHHAKAPSTTATATAASTASNADAAR